MYYQLCSKWQCSAVESKRLYDYLITIHNCYSCDTMRIMHICIAYMCVIIRYYRYSLCISYNAWQRGNKMAILSLDIKGAFPSVILEHLIHDMRSRGIPEEYTGWIKWKVEARCTTICFNDFNTTAIEIPRGLDQGCPLSGISYQFYNTGLIEVPNQHKGEDCVGFVDDTTILAEGANLQEACDKLMSIMTRCQGSRLCFLSLCSFWLCNKRRRRV